MRVALVAAEASGVVRLAQELRADGVDVEVVTSRALVEDVIRPGVVDLVHAYAAPGTRLALAAIAAAERARLTTVLTLYSAPAHVAAVLAASERVLGWSRRVVLSGVSSVVAAQAVRWIPEASVGVLPFGVDMDVWMAGTARASAEQVRFAAAMRLGRGSEAASLVRAFAAAVRFVAGEPDLHLTIAGDGPLRADLVALAAELGVSDRIEWPGWLTSEALHALYARSDAFIHPAGRASAATASLEARAVGLPIIARLSSGARDFVSPGVHGLLARDDAELAQFIARMALEEPMRRFIANRNRRERPPYDWPTVVQMHRSIYDAVVARGAAAEPPNQK